MEATGEWAALRALTSIGIGETVAHGANVRSQPSVDETVMALQAAVAAYEQHPTPAAGTAIAMACLWAISGAMQRMSRPSTEFQDFRAAIERALRAVGERIPTL